MRDKRYGAMPVLISRFNGPTSSIVRTILSSAINTPTSVKIPEREVEDAEPRGQETATWYSWNF